MRKGTVGKKRGGEIGEVMEKVGRGSRGSEGERRQGK